MKTSRLAASLVIGLASCRDVTLPPPPTTGSIQGVVVYGTDGRTEARPAIGATVELARQSAFDTAHPPAGAFRLAGLTSDEGTVVFRFDDLASGIAYAQSYTVRSLGAGFGKDLNLGTVVLGPTASVTGTVLRGDVTTSGGHGGTLVFVPEGPSLTQTADDGSFTLTRLPAGAFTLSTFRDGYVSQSIDGTLRAGEDFRLVPITLVPEQGTVPPASVTGRVQLLGAADSAGVMVTATRAQVMQTTSTDGDGAFSLDGLTPGPFTFTFTKAGFRPVTLRNVLARPGANALGTVVLAPGDSTGGAGGGTATGGGAATGGGLASGGGAATGGGTGTGGGRTGGGAGGGTGGGGGAFNGYDAGPVDPNFRVVFGDFQLGWPAGHLSTLVTVELRDDAGQPQADVVLRGVGPAGSAMVPSTVKTSSNGRATFDVQLPRAFGPFGFDLRPADGGVGSARLSLAVVPPPPGTVTTLVNRDHAGAAAATLSGPSALAQIRTPTALAVAADGTLYFGTPTPECVVRRVTTAGLLEVVAGSTCGNAGNGGAATAAKLASVTGLALDEARQRLYVTDGASGLIRVVQLDTGVISALAGGGTSSGPGFGDDGAATDAVFASPSWLQLRPEGPEGALYVLDLGHSRIRRIDLQQGRITGVQGLSSTEPRFNGCSTEYACGFDFDRSGAMYFTGASDNGSRNGQVIFRRAPDAGLSTIAGAFPPATFGEGLSSLLEPITNGASVTFDRVGNLFFTDWGGHAVRMIEAGTGRVFTVAGTGAQGSGADGVALTSALAYPAGLAIDAQGVLYVADTLNASIKTVWGVTTHPAVTPVMTVVGTTTASALLLQSPAQPLAVRLADPTGAPLVGFPVTWSAGLPGSWSYSTTSVTDSFGVANNLVRTGLVPGTYPYTASFQDVFGATAAGSPVQWAITAVPPDAGTLFTIANVDHSAGSSGIPGAAPIARLTSPNGLAVAADGTIYVVEQSSNRVRVIRPNGLIEHFAGSAQGTPGSSGAGLPATQAFLSSPTNVAVDSSNSYLYISDTANNVVRRVNLTTTPPTMENFAGYNGNPNIINEGAPAALVGLNQPGRLNVRVEGGVEYVYVSDTVHRRVVKIPTSGASSATYYDVARSQSGPGWSATAAGAIESLACNFDFDSRGGFYLSGHMYDGAGYNPQAVVRWDQGPVPFAHITGNVPNGAGTSLADGVPATQAWYSSPPWLAFDARDQLVLTAPSEHKVRRIDLAGIITTLAGDGTPGFAGEVALPSTPSRVSTPSQVVVRNGHIYFTDTGNHAVRVVW